MSYSDYEIVEPKPPPLWVYHLPPLKRIWDNPISQQLYKPVKFRYIPPPLAGFFAAFALSFFLNVIFQSEPFEDSGSLAGLTLSLGVTSAGIAVYASVRIIINALVMNPMRIRRLIDNHTLDSWMSMPLDDTTLFHSLNFPSLMGCLKAYENVVAVYAGLVVPFLIFSYKNGVGIGQILSSAEIYSTAPASYAVWIIFLPLILALHLTLAAGLYSYLLHQSHAIAVAVAHVAVCFGFTALARMTWFAAFPSENLTDIPIVIAGELLCVAILIGLAWLTGRIGSMVFARFRRPGFYEEEWASAAGLVQY